MASRPGAHIRVHFTAETAEGAEMNGASSMSFQNNLCDLRVLGGE